jgi:hypothetical protein
MEKFYLFGINMSSLFHILILNVRATNLKIAYASSHWLCFRIKYLPLNDASAVDAAPRHAGIERAHVILVHLPSLLKVVSQTRIR